MNQKFESYVATDATVQMIKSLGNLNSGALLEVDVYTREEHPESAVKNLHYEELANRLKADETLLAFSLDRANTDVRLIGILRSESDFAQLVKLATVEERILLCHIIGIGEAPLQELIKTCEPAT